MSTDSVVPASAPTSTDSSPYIRTYAKDVARLTGKTPESAKPIPVSSSKFVRPDDSLVTSDAQTGEPPKLSQLESEADIEMQIQSGKGDEPSGILQTIDLPSIKPGDIIQNSLSAAATGADQGREAILARLRSKAERQPANVPEPILEPATPEQSASEEPAPFHSYASDFADRIDQQHASTFAVLGAEQEVRSKPQVKERNRGLLPIIAGIVLIVVGGGVALAAYHFVTVNAPVVTAPIMPSLIVPDQRIALKGEGTQLMQAWSQAANQKFGSNEVASVYITESTTTKDGVTQVGGTGGDFITALNLSAPSILLRNIDPTSMVGIVNDGSQTRPFFILRVESYDRTFAGMLQWEGTMGNDLSVLYPAYPQPQPVIKTVIATSTATSSSSTKKDTTATTTATTTVVIQPIAAPYVPPHFIDEVVSNHDTRALVDSQGRTVLLYGYVDQQTLIIARDEAAFALLLSRLQASQQ